MRLPGALTLPVGIVLLLLGSADCHASSGRCSAASRLFMNEDAWHFWVSDSGDRELMRREINFPLKSGIDSTRKGLEAYIDEIARGKITHFLMNVNGQRANFPVRSADFEPVWASLDDPGRRNEKWVETLKRLYDSGIDPYRIWIDRCRAKGVSPWISVRMNDLHHWEDPRCPNVSTLWRQHPELLILPKDVGGNGFDYTKPRVRERMIGFIRAVLERYDPDGIELDLLRFVNYLPQGRERECAPVFTAFMRDVRKTIDAAAAKHGHGIALSVRVMAYPRDSQARGLQVDVWSKEGLVDFVMPCNFFSNIRYDISADEWRAWTGGRAEIVPGADSGVMENGARRLATVAEYRRWAAEMRKRGAKGGLYLYNLFGHPQDGEVWNGILSQGLDAADGGVPARAHAVITPVRVVAQEGVTNTACLLERRFGQVCEGKFLEGSGPVLEKGAWLLLDFGQELHGSVQIGSGAKSGKEASVRVRFGESVSEALTPLGEKGACNDHAIRDDVVSLPWMGRRVIGETGFRFVRIENVGGCPVQLDYVRAESIERPMEAVGSFRSSDERLNRIFDTAVRTVRLCCQDYLWDGIKRDRLVWLGDMHPEMMTILAVFGDVSVLTETLDYAMATTPADEWMNRMPTYTLWWIRDLAEWYRFSGDAKRLARYGDYLERTFDHVLTGFDAEGRWTAGTFLDWPTEHDKEAQTAGTQALALMAARETEFLAKALGREGLAKKAGDMIAKLLRLKPDPNGEKSAAALLALSGLRDARTMYGSVLSRNGHEGVSTFYGYYMLEAMSTAGEHRRALETVRDYWGAMLDVGATTFWEDFKLSWTNDCFRIDEMPVPGKKDVHGDYGEFCYKGFRHSLCHGWSCGPAAWCIWNVLGIRPLAVGCKKVEVKPFLGDLEWAEGAMALPDGGAVRVRVSKGGDGKLVVDVSAPDWVSVENERTEK